MSGSAIAGSRSNFPAVSPHSQPAPLTQVICRPCRTTRPFCAVPHRQRARRSRGVPVSAASSVKSAGPDKETSIELLHQAAETRAVNPKQVFTAITQLDKQKLSPDGWAEVLGGDSSPGRRWKLVFTTGTKQVQDALKGGKGGGVYFPLIAAQRWDGPKGEIENGVYLGHIASFSFLGPWAMTSRKMTFDFKRINIKLGPWKFGFNLKSGQFGTKKDPTEGEKEKPGPFFLFIHVDDKICVARGRGGGFAMWARTSPVWEAQAGLIQA